MSVLDRIFGGAARADARERERRVRRFHDEVLAARATASAAPVLTALRSRPAELGLTPDDVDLELEMVEGLIELAALKSSVEAGGALPVVATTHRAVDGDICHMIATASRPDVTGDAGGRLFLTDRRIVYLGTPGLNIGWPHVVEGRDADRDFTVRLRTGQTHTFRCNSYADTVRAAWLAGRMLGG
ncbi:MAG TPA: hypothetical protein VGK32_06235 [Vicinamibacterales bacterium]|jgi:hypothetical protein